MRLLRILFLSALTLILVCSAAQAQINWLGTTSSDVTIGENWDGGVVPGTTAEGDFGATTGSTTPSIPSAGWNPLYIGFNSSTPYTFEGPGKITIASNGNIDTMAATGDVVFNNGDLDMTRAAGIYASSSNDGTANITVNTTTFRMGLGSSSGHPYLRAYGGNITINPTVDFSGSGANRYLYCTAYAGKTITLANGVAAATRLLRLYVDGQAAGSGGTVILGNSTTWAGLSLIFNADLEINHNDSLGAPGTLGPTYASYTEFGAGASTGALVLTNGITSNESIYLVGRNTNAAEIRNKSGHNILSGMLGGEGAGATDGNMYTLESAGTAAGDLFEISGTIAPTTWNTGAYNVVLRGAGKGLVSGTISGTPIVVTAGTQDGGTIGVIKDDAGTWTLAGANTYTDATVVANGTLSLGSTGSIANSSSIQVKSGAFFNVSGLAGGGLTLAASQALKGGGTVTGSITAGSTNTITPGDSAGTLNITGDLSLTDGTLAYELSNNPLAGNDKIIVGGALAVAGNPNFALTALDGSLGSGSYRLIDYTGAAISDPNSIFSYSGVVPSGRQVFSFASAENQLDFNVAGDAANLIWVGADAVNPNYWDEGATGTVNWTGAADNHFYNSDNVTFDGTSSTFTPNIVGTVQPGNMNLTNALGTTYTLSGDNLVATNLIASGSGEFTFANANLTVNGAVTLNGTGKVTIANTGTLALPSTIALNSGTLAVNRADSVFSVTNALTGAGTLRKEGTNTVILDGNNSAFTGTIEVAQGTLRSVGTNALGTAAGGVTVLDGATLDIWGNGADTPAGSTEVVTIAGSGAGGIGALVTTQSFAGTSAHVQGLILAGDAKIAAIGGTARSILWVGDTTGFVQGNGHNLDVVVQEPLSGNVGTEIDWINVGDANLNNITVSGGGAFYLGGNTTLGPTTGTLTLKDKGRLGIYASLSGTSSTGVIDKPIVVENTPNGGGIEIYRGNKTIDSPITMSGNLNVDLVNSNSSTTSTLTLAGKLSGEGALNLHLIASSTTSRRGMVRLTSDLNDFTGPITIGGGGGFNAANPLYDRISLSVGDGGTTGSLGNGGTVTITGLPSSGTPYNSLYFNRGGAYTVNNNIALLGIARLWTQHVDGKPTFTGNISGPGNILLDGGYTTFSGTNTYTGWTDVRGLNAPATLQIAKRVSLYNGDTASWTAANVTAESYNNNISTIVFNVGGAEEFTAADIDLLAALGSAEDGFMNNATIGFDTTNAAGGDFAYSTAIVNPNAGANLRNLIKLGANSLTLSAANTYTGTTTVAGGTLALSGLGSLASSPVIDVQAGATLDVSNVAGAVWTLGSTQTLKGKGTVVGSILLSDGSAIEPGESPGILAITGSMDMSAGANMVWELATLTDDATGTPGTDFDLTTVSNTLTLGGTSKLTLNLAAVVTPDPLVPFWQSSHSWKVIDVGPGGSTVGNFALLVDGGPYSTAGAFSTLVDGSGDVYLNFAAVPEPATWLLLSIGLLGAVVGRRWRYR